MLHSRLQPIMVLATGSHCGKTTLVAGLCRVLADKGYQVAPFKSQNMALNSYVTDGGGEIARATAVQATAARQRPVVEMNPILLKPKSDTDCQLIVNGKAERDVTAEENFCRNTLRNRKLRVIKSAIKKLQSQFDVIVAEGAGSCAEPNFYAVDVVNIEVAKLLDARVFIVGDIDVGGVFAQFLGTYQILHDLDESFANRIEGFIINKFRGDPQLLQPGIEYLNRHCPIPVKAVIPFIPTLALEEEDRIRWPTRPSAMIRIAIPYLPRISNGSDFSLLAQEEGVELRLIRRVEELDAPDVVIIPGTKNTIGDLLILRETGIEEGIRRLADSTPIFGICGGFEMLGHNLADPDHSESDVDRLDGMGLLDVDFVFQRKKTVTCRTYNPTLFNPFSAAGPVNGYEIHCGKVSNSGCPALFTHSKGKDKDTDGAVHPDKPIFGTFIHDLFRNPRFCRAFVNYLRRRKGLSELLTPLPQPTQIEDSSLNLLADVIRENWPIDECCSGQKVHGTRNSNQLTEAASVCLQ